MSSESSTPQRKVAAARIIWLICTVLILLALVTLVVTGIITPRVFALLCLFLMAASGVILFRLMRSAPPFSTLTSASPILNRRKRSYVLAAGLLIWLIFALWMTRGGPWLPRLIGASFVLLLIFGNLARRSS